MSKKIVLTLGRNALGDDLARQMKAVKIISQAIVGLIAQGHKVIVTRGNESQVSVINRAFEAAAETEVHPSMLPMSVYIALSQGYIGYDLQDALREELLLRGISRPVATLVTQVEVDANNLTLLNPTKPIGSLLTEQEAELLTEQSYTLKEDAGRGYRRVVASPKPVDTTGKEMVKVLVDAGQVVITVGGSSISVTRESNHLRGVNTITDKDWAGVRLAETIGVGMLIILTAIEKVAISFGKEDEQWLDHLSLGDAERFTEEGHFVKGSVLPEVEAAALLARSRAGREALITVLSRVRGGIKGKTRAVIYR